MHLLIVDVLSSGVSNDAWSRGSTGAPLSSQSNSQLPQGEHGTQSHTAFRGCWFTLAALQSSPDEYQESRSHILQNGGKLFQHNTVNLVINKPPQTVFAACPVSLPASQLDALKKRPDFRVGKLHGRTHIVICKM